MADNDKLDSSRERGTPNEKTGSPFPDPRAPKQPRPDVEIVSGQPLPSTDRPDDGGIRAVRGDEGLRPDQLTTENDG